MIDPSLDTVESYTGKPSYSPVKHEKNVTTSSSTVFKDTREPPWKVYAATDEQPQASREQPWKYDAENKTKPFGYPCTK
ncbi:hypothetical protein ABVK25_001375 [Lepraria finkii]|uniref:Uncharacterized protein n=1 Tax=Lepraria finkii TaxID=1340010 RepID=A0ABR4BLH2_9LECA